MLKRFFQNRKQQKLVLGGILIGLSGLYAFGWHTFKGTPRYSLGELQTAIENKETDEIEDFVDVESVSAQVVDATMKQAYELASQDTIANYDILAQIGMSFGMGMLETMRPMMQQEIEDFLEEAIEQPALAGFDKLELTSIAKTKEDEAIATFSIPQASRNAEIPIDSIGLILNQQPTRRWQVTGVDERTLASFMNYVKE